MNPWPIAYTMYDDSTMKIYKSSVIEKKSKESPGTILEVNGEGIEVATKDGVILIKEIQFPNGKQMKIKDYLNGNSINKGLILK